MMMNRQGGGANAKAMNFGKSRARMTSGSDKQVKFAQVAGLQEEKGRIGRNCRYNSLFERARKSIGEDIPDKNDKEFHALVEACKDLTIRYIKSSDMFPQDSAFAIKNITNPMFLVDFICTNLPLKKRMRRLNCCVLMHCVHVLIVCWRY